MDLGSWKIGIVKGVFLTSLVFPLYALAEFGFPMTLDDLSESALILALFYAYYLALSVIGWLCIGFPSHWMICHYGDRRIEWYVIVVTVFSLGLKMLVPIEIIAILGGVALSQALLFRYYVFR